VERHVIEVIVRWLDGFGGLDAGAAGALAAMCILAAFVPVPPYDSGSGGRGIAGLMRFCGPAPNCARPAFQPMADRGGCDGRADDRLSGFAADTDDPYR
jgi:hypothetical protein